MTSYVQLGRGWRPNYQMTSHHALHRRSGRRGVAATLGLVAAVFVAGLVLGRLDGGTSHLRPAGPQPMQFYPK